MVRWVGYDFSVGLGSKGFVVDLDITPLANAPLGALIRGWEPAVPLEGDARNGIVQALEAEHPVVVRHPDTGEEILYVSRG